jgi:hypothetical protein
VIVPMANGTAAGMGLLAGEGSVPAGFPAQTCRNRSS